jgi:hypothetical protein
MAPLLYTASSCICTPNSLSQEVGLGLGAQAGEARLRDVFAQAGFTHFRLAAETPLNLILEARVRSRVQPTAAMASVRVPVRRVRPHRCGTTSATAPSW